MFLLSGRGGKRRGPPTAYGGQTRATPTRPGRLGVARVWRLGLRVAEAEAEAESRSLRVERSRCSSIDAKLNLINHRNSIKKL